MWKWRPTATSPHQPLPAREAPSRLSAQTSRTLRHPTFRWAPGHRTRPGAASAKGMGHRQRPGRVRRGSPGRQPLATPPLSGQPPGRRGNVAAGNRGSPRGLAAGCWPRGSRVQLRKLGTDQLGTDTACPDRAGPNPGQSCPSHRLVPPPAPRLRASPDSGTAQPGPSPSFSPVCRSQTPASSASGSLWPQPRVEATLGCASRCQAPGTWKAASHSAECHLIPSCTFNGTGTSPGERSAGPGSHGHPAGQRGGGRPAAWPAHGQPSPAVWQRATSSTAGLRGQPREPESPARQGQRFPSAPSA